MTCSCNTSSNCDQPYNAITQAVKDALAERVNELDKYATDAATSAIESKDSADASAGSALQAQTAEQNTMAIYQDAQALVPVILETSENIEKAAQAVEDALDTASSITVKTLLYTVIGGESAIVLDPSMDVRSVQAMYIEGVRQERGEEFNYDVPTRTVTLAEPLPVSAAGTKISLILGTINSDSGETLEDTLASSQGGSMIGLAGGGTVQDAINGISTSTNQTSDNMREQWRRELADLGLTLVDGSFEEGASLLDATSAIWFKAGAQCYTWSGAYPKDVPAGSTPTTSGGTQWDSIESITLGSDNAWARVGTEFEKSLKDYLQSLPSLSAVKYMTFVEYASLVAGNNNYNHDVKVQQVMDEAHELKCSVYFPTGRYVYDNAVNVWTYVRAVWGDGSAIITRRYGSQFSSPGVIDPAHDTRKLFRMMGGALGSQAIYGLIVDGNARSFTVPKHTDPDQSLPNQTYYGDVEPVDVGPYVYGPYGQTAVADTTYYDHSKKESGLTVFNLVFKDQPGGAVVGNGQNVRIFGNHFNGWYDHAVYIAGSNFTDLGNGILCTDIVVTGNVFRNRINSRGNGAVKARFGVNRYAVTGNSFDIVDYCLAFEMGNGAATQPFGQVVVSGNTATCDGMFMQIGNDVGTEWFSTGWLKSLTIVGNTVRSQDRIFLLGVSGGSTAYVMDGFSVQVANNRFYAPTFMSMYTFMTNTEWLLNDNIIEITGTAMITGVDQAVVNNSRLYLKDNILGVLRTDSQGYVALSNFQQVEVSNNTLRNLYFQVGSYTTDLTLEDNKVSYTTSLATRNFALMYSGTGPGLNNASIKRNKFIGGVGRCQLKFGSSASLDCIGNTFVGTSAPFLELHTTGYTPRIARVEDNLMRGAGVLVAPLAAGVLLASAGNFMSLINNTCMASNPTVPETITLFQDTGAQSWVAHYETIRCVRNSFKSALSAINATGTAQSGLSTTNKFWFGENATINTTVTCTYPTLNKANTDVVQTVNI